MQLDETTIALTFAIVGVVFSVAWLVLGIYGIQSIRDLRSAIRDSENSDEL